MSASRPTQTLRSSAGGDPSEPAVDEGWVVGRSPDVRSCTSCEWIGGTRGSPSLHAELDRTEEDTRDPSRSDRRWWPVMAQGHDGTSRGPRRSQTMQPLAE